VRDPRGLIEQQARAAAHDVGVDHRRVHFNTIPPVEQRNELFEGDARLESAEREYDPVTGIPRMSAIPVRIERGEFWAKPHLG
jgi:hypothetical protein